MPLYSLPICCGLVSSMVFHVSLLLQLPWTFLVTELPQLTTPLVSPTASFLLPPSSNSPLSKPLSVRGSGDCTAAMQE